jgi:hypothetical protein
MLWIAVCGYEYDSPDSHYPIVGPFPDEASAQAFADEQNRIEEKPLVFDVFTDDMMWRVNSLVSPDGYNR